MKCPECGLLTVERRLQDETEEFDTGTSLGVVLCRSEKVPVDRCSKCGCTTSGPSAAARRSDARLRAVLAAVKGRDEADRYPDPWPKEQA